MNRGKYIVLEGPEGVGKTTQLMELARRLQAAGLPVRTLREPDSQSDLTARALRQLTQDPRYPMNTNTEVLLYNAARSQSLQVIRKSVEQGVICLVDRNYLTTLAIQYYGRADVPDYDTINRIIAFAVNGVEPDLTVVLDAPVPVLKERLKGRYHGERFDNLDAAFLERVRAGYLWEAKQRNLPVVFATDEPDDVSNQIWKLVSDTLARRDSQAAAASEPTAIKEILAQKQLAAAPHEPPVDESTLEASPAADNTPVTTDAPAGPIVPDSNAFYVPDSLDDETANRYRTGLQQLLEHRQELLQALPGKAEDKDAIGQQLVPAACLPDRSVLHLQTGSGSLPAEIESSLKTTHGETSEASVKLVDFWPRSELQLAAVAAYPYSNRPLDEIKTEVDSWPYDQKAAVLQALLRSPGATVLAGTSYIFEGLLTLAMCYDLQALRGVALALQEATPRYGYDVPQAVIDAGLSDKYEACFDASLTLHSQLQAAGYAAEAQLAVLLGHRQRGTLTLSGQTLQRLQTGETLSRANRRLVGDLVAAVRSVHPFAGDVLAPLEAAAA